jgi:fructose-1,6-bisphosphatase/inositol monophosphatase family enzyme
MKFYNKLTQKNALGVIALTAITGFCGAVCCQNQERYSSEVQQMVSIMKEATAQEILPRWGKVEVRAKNENYGFKDLVTQADIQASVYILNNIRPMFPGSYSEEQKFDDRFDPKNTMLWQIDPVDGTQEFCEGFKEGYSCLAALLKKQANGTFFPVAGIIYLPALDTLWYSDGVGHVSFLVNGQPKALPTYSRQELCGYQRKVAPSQRLERFYKELGDRLGINTKIVLSGGAGASIADLLSGKINLIIMNNNSTKDWDIGMAEPIIKSLGGFICDFEGNEFTYNRQDTPGLCEPYNMRGYIISIVFKKEEILPLITNDLFEDKLKKVK